MQTPIEKAVSVAGGLSELGDAIGVTRPMVYQWINRIRPVAAKHCIPIEQATQGAVTRYQLRPDVFGKSPDQAEQAA